MPPEQLPWDRRDFRKHDRSGPDRRFTSEGGGRGGFGGGDHRWREQHYHPHAPPYHHHRNHPPPPQRWYSDFRSSRPIPPGHVKQGGWTTHADEAGRGFSPFGSRYSDKNIEDENFRPFGSRGEGRYFKSHKEYKGSFSQKDWKSPSWEPPVASSNGFGRPNGMVTKQKSVENTLSYPSNSSKGNNSENGDTCHNNGGKGNNLENAPNNTSKGSTSPRRHPDSLSGQPQAVSKENNEKVGVTGDEPTGSIQKADNENAVGSTVWKLKWSQSGSMSSRGSGLSRSSSSKSTGVDSVDKKVEMLQKNMIPVDSPVPICVETTDRVTSDDTGSRKKPRLGWGEGLAKYEKKKVEGPEDGILKDVLANSVSTAEAVQLPSVDVLSKSPKATNRLDCASPATPSSVACSSSPGIEEKESIKAVNIDHDPENLSFSCSIASQFLCEEPTFNLENLELESLATLSSSINEMLRPNDPSSVRATLMNKLLVWKANVLKALEVTESEIDSLEIEFKSLVAEHKNRCPHPVDSSFNQAECHSNSCEEVIYSSLRPAPLQLMASRDMNVESPPADDEDSLSDEDDTASLDYDNSNVVQHQDLAGVGSMYYDCQHIYEAIVASNIDSASMVLEELNKLLPARHCLFNVFTGVNVSSLLGDSSLIRDKFLKRKRSLLFKEKVLTLKYRVFQHFWREGRVVSLSKLRRKSHKKLDLCRSGYKKNRLSNRSRISQPAGSSRKVPVEEVIEFINELLKESQIMPCRSTLKMPAMILDKGIKMSRFISNNALVEDPYAAERERSMINLWTPGETKIFIDNLSVYGKDFTKISSFLQHKTVADCVEFYYKNHKSESFRRAKPGLTKQSKSQSTTYMVTNGKRWHREANAASLDVLGEASIIASNAIEFQQKCASSRIFPGSSSLQKAPPRIFHSPLERSNSLDNNEAAVADVLAGICGSLYSGEAMSSCITSSVDPVDGYHQRVTSCVRRPLTPDVTQSVDDECSDESCGEMVDPTNWTDEEKSFFVQAVSSYGKDFEMISQCLRTRSVEQCKIFFSKAQKCLGLGIVTPIPSNAAVCGGGDDGGSGSSDTEDACVVQTVSVIANDDSECKMEVDLPEKSSHESDITRTSELKPDFMTSAECCEPCPLHSIITEPALKGSPIADDTFVNDKQVVDSNVGGEEPICVDGSMTEVGFKTSVISTTIIKSEQVDEVGSDHGPPNGDSSNGNVLPKLSDGHRMEDNEEQQHILSDDDVESKKDENGGAEFTEVEVVSSAPVEMKADNEGQQLISHPSVDSFSSVQNDLGCQNLPLQLTGHPASLEPSQLFSVPVKYQRHSSTDAQPDVRISGYSLPDSVEPSHILRGYPVSVQTLKEISGDIMKHIPIQNIPKRDEKLNLELHTDFPLRKCSTGLRDQIEHVSIPPPQPHNLGPQSSCSTDVDKPQPSRNGDVKLFGKILISSQEKTSSFDRDVSIDNNDGQHCPKAGHHRQSLTLKFSAEDKAVDLDGVQSKVGCNSYPVTENNNIPGKSFNCWDESRTKRPSIFQPLRDSALLLAKYPAAFSSHSTPTLKFDQPPTPPLNGIIQDDHHPFFTTSDLNNGISDYKLLRNRELQPFNMSNTTQPQDVLFSEMQRRNGFSVAQAMQQQAARSMVAIDVGRGVPIGGQCSGVSDPITAIKLHFAKTQSISMQAGNLIREDDSWRSNGDVGR